MAKVLITGMSGTGKSTALRVLAELGHDVADTDDPGWCVPEPGVTDAAWRWDESKIAALLDRPQRHHLFVSGTRENQARFYDRFDAVVLLTAPAEVIMERIAARTEHDYGKSTDERERILTQIDTVEPLLRAGATDVVDATAPAADVVFALLTIAGRR